MLEPAHDKILGVHPFVYVVLPAYNEEAALRRLIPNIAKTLCDAKRPFEILVVNDGSTDTTTALLGSLAASCFTRELRHEHNRGYGAALKTGFLWVAEHANPMDAVVTLDADNTHDPVYIPLLLDQLEKGFSAVTASYTMKGGSVSGVPALRRLMSLFLNTLFYWTFLLPGIRTYTNGFRAYRANVLKSIHLKYGPRLIDEAGFPGGTEFFLKAAGLGGTFTEIPFLLHYEERGRGSKIHLGPTIGRYLKLVVGGHRYIHS